MKIEVREVPGKVWCPLCDVLGEESEQPGVYAEQHNDRHHAGKPIATVRRD